MKTFIGNGYSRAFVRSASKQRTPREPDDNETEKPPIVYLSYVADVSERIRKVCWDFNIRKVFKSGPTLRDILTKVKDPLPITKQSNVVYEVPCTCGKVYIGEPSVLADVKKHRSYTREARILQGKPNMIKRGLHNYIPYTYTRMCTRLSSNSARY